MQLKDLALVRAAINQTVKLMRHVAKRVHFIKDFKQTRSSRKNRRLIIRLNPTRNFKDVHSVSKQLLYFKKQA